MTAILIYSTMDRVKTGANTKSVRAHQSIQSATFGKRSANSVLLAAILALYPELWRLPRNNRGALGFAGKTLNMMIRRSIDIQSSSFSLWGISLAALAAFPLTHPALAHSFSASPKHLSGTDRLATIVQTPPPRSIPTTLKQSPSISSPQPLGNLAQTPSIERWVQVAEIRGTATIKGRAAKVGDRLAIGEELITGDNSQVRLAIDNHTGIVEVAEKTALTIETLSTDPTKPETTVFISRGRVRMSISPFVAKLAESSALQNTSETRLASLSNFSDTSLAQQRRSSAKNAPVKVRTPRGVAGVRGTSFGVNVGPNGKTGIDTIDGSVAVAGKEREVIVNAGYWATIDEAGEPTVTKLNPEISTLVVAKAVRVGAQNFRLSGQVKPMDLVYVNGQAIATDADGRFKVGGYLPLNRRLTIVVRGPSVREKRYDLVVP